MFRSLLYAHHSAIVSYLYWMVGDRGIAEELAADVWVVVVHKPQWFAGHGDPRAALMSTARNHYRNYRRKRQRRGEQRPGVEMITRLLENRLVERLLGGVRRRGEERRGRDTRATPCTEPDSSVDPMAAVDRRLDLRRAIADLSPRRQEALFLYYHEDLAPAEIAERMGISRQAVEKLLKQSFIALKASPRLAGWDETEVGT